MTTHTSRDGRRTDRCIDPRQALEAALQVEVPVIFDDMDSDVPLMVGALTVRRERLPGWERHDHGDEVLFLLSGHATMTVRAPDGRVADHEARAGDMLFIPKGSAHMGTLHSDTVDVLFMTPRTGTAEWADGEEPPAPALDRPAAEPWTSLMRYKRWADAQLLAALLGRPDLEPHGEIIRDVVGHFHVVDRIFQAHLQGVPHAFTSTRLEGGATLCELRDDVLRVDDWYVAYAERVDRAALRERLPIRYTDGTESVLTRADVLLHVSHHGTYHRGNIGVLMRTLGMDPLPDRVVDYVAQCEPRA